MWGGVFGLLWHFLQKERAEESELTKKRLINQLKVAVFSQRIKGGIDGDRLWVEHPKRREIYADGLTITDIELLLHDIGWPPLLPQPHT